MTIVRPRKCASRLDKSVDVNSDLPKWLFAQPESAALRVQPCLEAIRRALEEHDCELQVSLHFNDTGQTAPEMRVMPTGREKSSGG